MKNFKWVYLLVAVAMLMAMLPMGTVSAAPTAAVACAKDHTVSAGDQLSLIAEKEYGAVTAYWPIMAFTNQKNKEDSSYARIENPDLIEVGWKLCLVSVDEANAFLKEFPGPNTPAGVAMLFGKGAKGQVIVASWWTNGGEFAGLNEMFKQFKAANPDVEIVNAAVAGGAGTNFKGQLLSQLLGGVAPDTFQLHAGWEADTYNPGVLIENVDDIYTSEKLESVFPPTLLSMLKFKDHYWGVPVNIHRSNVLWYNKDVLAKAGVNPPTTWEEFFAAVEKLKAAGVQPIALGGKDGFELQHTFEDILAGSMTAEEYAGLWTGKTSWKSPKVTAALETFKKYIAEANKDHAAHTWASAAQQVIDGKAAFNIMGDWFYGQVISGNAVDKIGYVAVPGSKGVFVALSDSFARPTKRPNKEASDAWLKLSGSKAAQEAFNKQKGSICARTDCDYSTFNTYLQSAAKDWTTDAIVPSVVHGAAATPSWATKGFADPIVLFATSGDVAAAQAALVQAAIDAGYPQ